MTQLNTAFMKEVKQVLSKWEETGLLGGGTDKYQKSVLAVLLENQSLMCGVSNPPMNSEVMTNLVASVYRDFYGSKLISMQPLLGPAGLIYYLRFRYRSKEQKIDDGVAPAIGEMAITRRTEEQPANLYIYGEEEKDDLPKIDLVLESEEVCAKTRRLKSRVKNMWHAEGGLRAECIPELAALIRDEIFREICTDLKNNAGTVARFDIRTALGDSLKEKYESLYVKLVEVSSVIHRKTLRGGANWIVTHPRIAEFFTSACSCFGPSPSKDGPVQYCGTLNSRWRLYADPQFDPSTMLIGYKGDSFMDAGYFLAPYVPFSYVSQAFSEECIPDKHLLMRYGKKLLREGSKFYARMTVDGLDDLPGNLSK